MLPTPPESSTSPRGLLMLRPMLMPTTLDMVDTDTVLAMPDMAMAMLPMAMATTERGLLMLSLRPMLMLTTMELMVLAMLDMDMVLAMLDTLLPMVAMPT